MVHASEVAFWEDTLKRSPEELAASLFSSVPSVPYSLIAIESTAKGIGNYFHRMWEAAVKKESNFKAVFVPWFEIDIYQLPVKNRHKFIESMTEFDWYQWSCGATLEGINWYNDFRSGKNYSDEKMMEEFPPTADDAFLSTGRRVFNKSYVKSLEIDVCKPEFTGEVSAMSRAGENSLKNISFTKKPNGNLHIWALPDNTLKIKYRYCFFADIGGRSEKADFSTLSGMDRVWMMDGGDPEAILTWRGHIDQDLFAYKCAQICMAYSIPEIGEYPLLAIETNSLKKEKGEGDHFLTILDELKDIYPNLYIRNEFEKVGDIYMPKYGFQTNHKTKGMIVDALNAAMREKFMSQTGEQEGRGYTEHDQRAIDEYNWFEYKTDGSMGAVEGKNDDITIGRAGSVWLATKFMPMPFLIEDKKPVLSGKIKKASDF